MKQTPFWLPADGIPLRLYVLRHGEVDHSHRDYLYGQMDVGLSEKGTRQSIAAGEFLANIPIDAVYTSDLVRARYLGMEIARHHGLQPGVDDRLRERHFGHWQGMPWREVEADYQQEVAAYQRDRYTYRVPGNAENFHDVRGRVVPAVTEIAHRHPGQHVVITAHSGPIRILLAEMLAMPITSIFTFELDYCCLNIIDVYASGRTRVRLLNGTHHLEDEAP